MIYCSWKDKGRSSFCLLTCFFFLRSRVWTHSLMLVRQVLPLGPLCQPFFVGSFQDRVSWTICPGLTLSQYPPDLASWVARITDLATGPHLILFFVIGSQLCSSGWPGTCDLPASIFLTLRLQVTGMHHYTWILKLPYKPFITIPTLLNIGAGRTPA
jgi:hypothetical protein